MGKNSRCKVHVLGNKGCKEGGDNTDPGRIELFPDKIDRCYQDDCTQKREDTQGELVDSKYAHERRVGQNKSEAKILIIEQGAGLELFKGDNGEPFRHAVPAREDVMRLFNIIGSVAAGVSLINGKADDNCAEDNQQNPMAWVYPHGRHG